MPNSLERHACLAEVTAEELAIARETMERMTDAPYLFAVVTGTHQYGFTSPDSDIDVRGAYALPTRLHLGINPPPDHREIVDMGGGREVDGVAFEIGRFLELVLKGSGNLIEELFSPIVLHDGGYLQALREGVSGCLSKRLLRHYLGFFDACMKKLRDGKRPPEVKTALYAVRIALTGIKMLESGRVESHLPTLNRRFELDFVEDWIAKKTTEHEPIPKGQLEPMLTRLRPLRNRLLEAAKDSALPEKPNHVELLDELLIRVRMTYL